MYRAFSCCHLYQSWPVCLLNLLFLVTIYESYDWTFALLEWIGFLLPWICIISLAWIQSFFKVSVVFEYFFVPCHPNWWASVLSRSFVHWRRPVPYFYFYTQVVLGFVLFFFIFLFFFFFFLGRGRRLFSLILAFTTKISFQLESWTNI